ncbi:hypothetical protein EIN_448370 [Entamoeba invadens IP1]|uniref:Uncharacterized protein n=1 Tax=Entamoeba invadens IP1 TaxID=370355 RepID=L7FLP1_ENTIV|nr:hypothetical protein EIN_448370 [Entamoeba invadens IP1]ELP89086.1 hypothetical protein EIN_448370 [Entamoeba invadens IP1]|eukprot:XP_004255857.1 hypothetical protein EIN_448370 [Entamoeba invadens IP1]
MLPIINRPLLNEAELTTVHERLFGPDICVLQDDEQSELPKSTIKELVRSYITTKDQLVSASDTLAKMSEYYVSNTEVSITKEDQMKSLQEQMEIHERIYDKMDEEDKRREEIKQKCHQLQLQLTTLKEIINNIIKCNKNDDLTFYKNYDDNIYDMIDLETKLCDEEKSPLLLKIADIELKHKNKIERYKNLLKMTGEFKLEFFGQFGLPKNSVFEDFHTLEKNIKSKFGKVLYQTKGVPNENGIQTIFNTEQKFCVVFKKTGKEVYCGCCVIKSEGKQEVYPFSIKEDGHVILDVKCDNYFIDTNNKAITFGNYTVELAKQQQVNVSNNFVSNPLHQSLMGAQRSSKQVVCGMNVVFNPQVQNPIQSDKPQNLFMSQHNETVPLNQQIIGASTSSKQFAYPTNPFSNLQVQNTVQSDNVLGLFVSQHAEVILNKTTFKEECLTIISLI